MEDPATLQDGDEVFDVPARLLGVRNLADGTAQPVSEYTPVNVVPIPAGLEQVPFLNSRPVRVPQEIRSEDNAVTASTIILTETGSSYLRLW